MRRVRECVCIQFSRVSPRLLSFLRRINHILVSKIRLLPIARMPRIISLEAFCELTEKLDRMTAVGAPSRYIVATGVSLPVLASRLVLPYAPPNAYNWRLSPPAGEYEK
jgi:hypothetical protein